VNCNCNFVFACTLTTAAVIHVSCCVHVFSEQKEFRFPAPPKPGVYQYTIVLRSDSYLGLDQSHTFKVTTHACTHIPRERRSVVWVFGFDFCPVNIGGDRCKISIWPGAILVANTHVMEGRRCLDASHPRTYQWEEAQQNGKQVAYTECSQD